MDFKYSIHVAPRTKLLHGGEGSAQVTQSTQPRTQVIPTPCPA